MSNAHAEATRSYLDGSEIVITSPGVNTTGSTKSKNERDVDALVHSDKIHSTRSLKHRVIRICSILQQITGPMISTFAFIHLTAPIAANFGGSQASNRMILLGREYYQGALTEPLLVFIPLGIHMGSGLVKRFLLGPPKRPNLLLATGYASLIALPIHISVHRLLPSNPNPPISSLSPSEMNIEFVKVGFSLWPIVSWVAYGGLVAVVITHAGEGASIVVRSLTGKGLSKKWRRSVSAVTWGLVMSGLFWLSREPLQLRGLQLARVMAVYDNSWSHQIVQL